MEATLFKEPLVSEAISFAKQYMSNYDASHDWQHIRRVVGLALEITRQEEIRQGNVFDHRVVLLAALLHDVGDRKYLETGQDGTRLVADTLVKFGADTRLAERVQDIVSHVSFSNESKNPESVREALLRNRELAIVQDADRLDAIGAIGIGRCFTFGAARAAGRDMDDSIQHFDDKLVKLAGMMKTETGKSLAAERTRRLLEFKQWWLDETQIAIDQI